MTTEKKTTALRERMREDLRLRNYSPLREVYGEVSREASVTQGPFMLEQVAGHSDLNLPDRLHPTARGHELIAQTVWPSLKSILASEVDAAHSTSISPERYRLERSLYLK
jgi:lysophospholipase L1-like esterase